MYADKNLFEALASIWQLVVAALFGPRSKQETDELSAAGVIPQRVSSTDPVLDSYRNITGLER